MFEFFVAVLGLFIISQYEKWKCAKDYREYMTEQKEGLNIKWVQLHYRKYQNTKNFN